MLNEWHQIIKKLNVMYFLNRELQKINLLRGLIPQKGQDICRNMQKKAREGKYTKIRIKSLLENISCNFLDTHEWLKFKSHP